MNYRSNYNDYISYVRSLGRRKDDGGYYELHHIVPRCLGGDNSPENLVLLTAREHILAHYLLCRIYRDDKAAYPKMAAAFRLMLTLSSQARREGFSARKYGRYREIAARMLSESRTGMKMPEETKARLSEKKKEYFKTHSGTFRGKKHTAESRRLMSLARMFKIRCLENGKIYNTCADAAKDLGICTPDLVGRSLSGKAPDASGYHFEYSDIKKEHPRHAEEWNRKIAAANKGKKVSEETRKRQSEAKKRLYARRAESAGAGIDKADEGGKIVRK